MKSSGCTYSSIVPGGVTIEHLDGDASDGELIHHARVDRDPAVGSRVAGMTTRRARPKLSPMSVRPGDEKQPDVMPEGGPVMATIVPKPRDLGDNFMVRRALPAVEKHMVGPFIFWDEFGPTRFEPGKGLDVRTQRHI